MAYECGAGRGPHYRYLTRPRKNKVHPWGSASTAGLSMPRKQNELDILAAFWRTMCKPADTTMPQTYRKNGQKFGSKFYGNRIETRTAMGGVSTCIGWKFSRKDWPDPQNSPKTVCFNPTLDRPVSCPDQLPLIGRAPPCQHRSPGIVPDFLPSVLRWSCRGRLYPLA